MRLESETTLRVTCDARKTFGKLRGEKGNMHRAWPHYVQSTFIARVRAVYTSPRLGRHSPQESIAGLTLNRKPYANAPK